jgi:hypothetical protein
MKRTLALLSLLLVLLIDVPCGDCAGSGKVWNTFGGPVHAIWSCGGCQGHGRKPVAVHWLRSLAG